LKINENDDKLIKKYINGNDDESRGGDKS